MFKKNPNRPPLVVELKRVAQGYKVAPNDSHALFTVKRIIRTMYRPDLVPQGSTLGIEQNGLSIPSTIIQPPSHFTLPSFTGWFSLTLIHPIEQQAFPQFFNPNIQLAPFSFATRNAKLYKYYRNSMISMWRQNVKKHLSAAHCRRTLMGDVSSIVRIHGFLQNWGLINFPSRQHTKGVLLRPAQKLTCYVCESAESEVYHVAAVEDVLFQVCSDCFQKKVYPSEIQESEFKEVLQQNYKQIKHREMSNSQILKLLDVLATSGSSRQKDKQVWNMAQRQFPQFTKEELVYNFLKIPLHSEMNANIFQNNEDLLQSQNNPTQPTVFQDFQNPLQSSIAIAYYLLKQNKDSDGKIKRIFQAAEDHSQFLAKIQEDKIQELTKMLLDVSFSKLQLKSLFIHQYERLVEKCFFSQRTIVANTLAESLKRNLRFLQRNEEPQNLQEQQRLQLEQ